jgi:hypothetical protein
MIAFHDVIHTPQLVELGVLSPAAGRDSEHEE